MVVHVEVVVRTLLHAAEVGQLWQDLAGHAERQHQLEPAERAVAPDDPFELGEDPLRRHRGEGGRKAARNLGSGAVDGQPQLDGEAGKAEGSQRIRRKRRRRDHPQPPGFEVHPAAERIDQLAAGEGLGDRIDREIALAEVILDRRAAERSEVDLPRVVACDHSPRPESLGQREGGRADPAGERACDRRGVSRDRHIKIDRRPPQQPVSDQTADQPCVGSGEQPPQRSKRIAGHVRHAHAGTPSR